ncbi:flagellar biosynthetic protein FliR [Oxalobacteraceae bacterium OM1]|nr:flagellar biosynthetic protein FliR [Oxalobacteraceae bacterium OM1]
MITLTSAELNTWIAAFLWPLTRILGLIAVAPPFGNPSVPITVKLSLGVMLALIVAPAIPAMPAMDPTSFAGLLILGQQLIIGLSMGFAMRLVFAAIELAGEVTGLTMGFGFATFFDPQTRGRSSAISQFLVLLATMLFLSTNAHLLLLAALTESFTTLPVSAAPLSGAGFREMAVLGGKVFSSGLQLALPMVAALLITNIALGILTRAAPQLNLFGIGFPITLSVGFLVLTLSLPFLATPMGRLLADGIDAIGKFSAAAAPGRTSR